MANGFNAVIKRTPICKATGESAKLGSRRIFSPQFKLQVLDSYRIDSDCKGNQRATARKYGIHRRQIQKWLQAEVTLRGAVRGKKSSSEAPPSPLLPPNIIPQPFQPLDCSTVRRDPSPSPPPMPAGPVDLSVRRSPAPETIWSPVPRPATPVAAWDLSFKPHVISYDANFNVTQKFGYEVEAPPPPAPPRPVAPAPPDSKPFKLFRPYLEDFAPKYEPQAAPSPPYTPQCVEYQPHYDPYHVDTSFNCFGVTSAFEKVIPREGHLSPVCSPLSYVDYDTLPPSPFGCSMGSKHRQSYSLDFKLQAIRSYHQDLECRGNQRAVASKYRIHRRQVQKWLKQEDQLRQRNEGVKVVAGIS